MKRGRSDAETCRLNGWGAGTRLVGDEGYGPTIIRITAVGERTILACCESVNGKPWCTESTWTLTGRDWRRAS